MTGVIKRTFKDVTRFFCNYSWLLKCTVFFASLIKVFSHIRTNFTFFIWADNHITMQSSLFPCSTLREKSLNTEFFRARIFTHLDWTRRDTPYLSVFSPNAGKYGREKTPYLDTLHVVQVARIHIFNKL